MLDECPFWLYRCSSCFAGGHPGLEAHWFLVPQAFLTSIVQALVGATSAEYPCNRFTVS